MGKQRSGLRISAGCARRMKRRSFQTCFGKMSERMERMGDLCKEILVKRVMTTAEKILRAVLIAVTVLCIAAGLMLWPFLPAGIVLAVGCYFLVPGLDLEYEYLYVNGEIDIDKIMAKQRRKRCASYDVANLELAAPTGAAALDRYLQQKDVRVRDYTSRRPNVDSWTLVFNSRKGWEPVKLELDEEIIGDIRRRAPRKVMA